MTRSLHERDAFLTFTMTFLLALALLSAGLAYVMDQSPWRHVIWTVPDVIWGLGAALAMVAVFGGVSSARDQAEAILGRSLAACRWYDLALVAVLVGIIEEVLFRGILEPWAATWNPRAAFLIVNLLFGALHSVSWIYMILASVLGGFLSVLAHSVGEFNLLRPIVAHAVYDFIGFVWIAESYRRRKTGEHQN